MVGGNSAGKDGADGEFLVLGTSPIARSLSDALIAGGARSRISAEWSGLSRSGTMAIVAEPTMVDRTRDLLASIRATDSTLAVAVLVRPSAVIGDPPLPGATLHIDCSDGLDGTVQAVQSYRPTTEFELQFRGMLRESVVESLRSGFRTHAECESPHLRFQSRLTGEVNAIVPFGGVGIRGRLIVSATQDSLRAILNRSLDTIALDGKEFDVDHLRGASGEIANLALGDLQRRMRTFGVSLSLGYPMHMEGTHSRLSFHGDRIAMVCPLTTDVGPIGVEATLYQAPTELGAGPPIDSRADGPGDLTFF